MKVVPHRSSMAAKRAKPQCRPAPRVSGPGDLVLEGHPHVNSGLAVETFRQQEIGMPIAVISMRPSRSSCRTAESAK